jgi:hypothetical protein
MPRRARPARAARMTLPVCSPALSSTTTRGTFDHGKAPRKPSRSYAFQVLSAVKTSSRGERS